MISHNNNLQQRCVNHIYGLWHWYGESLVNEMSPIETHVNCLNSAGRFHYFSPY